MNVVIDATRQPIVFARDGEVFCNSRDLADAFEKRHDNVIRDIDNLISQDGSSILRNLFVEQSSYHEAARKQVRSYDMNRDGFTLLAMGFTGAKALKWKLRYIDAFNTMEKELRSRPVADLNDPATLRKYLLDYSEKVIALEAKVQAQAPDVAALERIAKSDGLLTTTDAAKTLGIPPQKLFKWLDMHNWTYRRPGNPERIAYQAKIQAGYLDHKTHTFQRSDGSEKTVSRVVITPAGLANLAKHFGVGDPRLF